MDSSIRVSNETKAKIDRLRLADESYDGVLRRLISDEDPVRIGTWDEDTADRARDAVDRSRTEFR